MTTVLQFKIVESNATTASAMVFFMGPFRDRSTAALAIRRGQAERVQHPVPWSREAEKSRRDDGDNRKSENRFHDPSRDRSTTAAVAIRRGKAERVQHPMPRRREAKNPDRDDGDNRKRENRLHDGLP